MSVGWTQKRTRIKCRHEATRGKKEEAQISTENEADEVETEQSIEAERDKGYNTRSWRAQRQGGNESENGAV